MTANVEARPYKEGRAVLEVLWIFLRLGVTSFGGPIAHLVQRATRIPRLCEIIIAWTGNAGFLSHALQAQNARHKGLFQQPVYTNDCWGAGNRRKELSLYVGPPGVS
jgi:hypothetical protein